MIDWILHRPPHLSNQAEVRVAELLRGLADSHYQWTVIWGYYYQDSRGVQREGDFLILGPAGGLLVLEVKSTLPRHFPETGRWEGAHDEDPISQLNNEWHAVIQGIKAKGNPPHITKALCVPGVVAPDDVANFQGIPRKWLVTGNDLENWIPTWLRIFGERARHKVDPLQKRAVLEAFGQGSLPEEKRAFIDHTEQLFKRQFLSRFALLDQLSENRQLLIHGGTGTGKTWHALELAIRHARAGAGQRVLFLTYNKALTAQLRRLVALRQIDRGEVVVHGCGQCGGFAGEGAEFEEQFLPSARGSIPWLASCQPKLTPSNPPSPPSDSPQRRSLPSPLTTPGSRRSSLGSRPTSAIPTAHGNPRK